MPHWRDAFKSSKSKSLANRWPSILVRGLTSTLEQHHRVRILDEAVVDAVKLSSRYISGRQLPDKAISLIDTAWHGLTSVNQPHLRS